MLTKCNSIIYDKKMKEIEKIQKWKRQTKKHVTVRPNWEPKNHFFNQVIEPDEFFQLYENVCEDIRTFILFSICSE